ncbi:AbrB/MazE/SpoVT family DNA-binding domain-containing protein [Svornostia abyssi]|uniref:AbrB/MazE/SpoVT family DNA-binding domain-containing protein n=1 Tax=Svornostia abyssi TaxID=2898438 RepID=A0ABY5PLS4_9ACTN|nr:AbrB/MazE/SpoVT family DNA-binding domain-containing protein [Parviterribacteraceae bacterium J379]
MAQETGGHSVTIGRQGRLVIPATVRGELGLHEGDRLTLRVERGRLVLAPDRAKVEPLRGMFRDLAPAGGVVDELIAERREEARREDAD